MAWQTNNFICLDELKTILSVQNVHKQNLKNIQKILERIHCKRKD